MVGIGLVIYGIVAMFAAALIGSELDRGDEQSATFALLYCAFWPVGVALLLGCLIGTRKSRRVQP